MVLAATVIILLANRKMFFETDHVGKLLESSFKKAGNEQEFQEISAAVVR